MGKPISQLMRMNLNYEVFQPTKSEVNLKEISEIEKFLISCEPSVIIMAAGVVGGIEKNIEAPFDLSMDNNLMITNLLATAHKCRIQHLINLVPACVYPANISGRARVETLLCSRMESSSLPYSMAKLTGLISVEAAKKQYGHKWLNMIVTNVYGNDIELDSHKSHVIPALLKKFHEAKTSSLPYVSLLGNGKAVREFIHTSDLARAVAFVLEKDLFNEATINVSGEEIITIESLAKLLVEVVRYEGSLVFSNDGKDGTSVKLIDGTFLMNKGWHPKVSLKEGLEEAYRNFKNSK